MTWAWCSRSPIAPWCFRDTLTALLVAWPLLALAGHGDAPVVFTQPLTIATTTVTEAEFLTGAAGTPATIGGELRLPVTQAPVPVVILLHGAGGVSPNVRHWADTLNDIGLGVLILDSFNGRGIAETSTDPSRLAHAAMLVDAYRALAAVAAHPRVDGRRVAVMGFAKGGWAALYANVRRFQRLHGPKGFEFAAAIAFYPPCTTTYLDDDLVSLRPLRIVHGTADDWAPDRRVPAVHGAPPSRRRRCCARRARRRPSPVRPPGHAAALAVAERAAAGMPDGGACRRRCRGSRDGSAADA